MSVSPSPDPSSTLRQAVAAHQGGDLATADRLYAAVLAADPRNADALHLSGVLEAQRGNASGAVERIRRSVDLAPGNPAAHLNLGNALRDLGRVDEALASYERALKLNSRYPQALLNRGKLLSARARHSEALASFDAALRLEPNSAECHYFRGNALAALARYADAIAAYERATKLHPQFAEAHLNRGNALAALGQAEEAIAAFDRAIAVAPKAAEAHYNRGNALERLGLLEAAAESFGRALALRPEYPEALYNRGLVFRNLRRHDESTADFERLVALSPEYPYALGNLLHSRLQACDWRGYDDLVAAVTAAVRAGKRADLPFSFLSAGESPADQLACARLYAAARFPAAPEPLWRGERYRHDRIRIAYLSADFHDHATARLMVELLERHDRTRFELTAISYGPDADSPMRQRLRAAFDRFIDVGGLDDRAAAEQIRHIETDIAVDLKGYTRDARPGILTHRPAPVQATYLGFPGTLGLAAIDYIIADTITIPEAHDSFYEERVVRLPDCYQPTDTRRRAAPAPTRKDVGLPEGAFVFCCFNNNYKITPAVFDVWMRLLAKVPDSVLWLFTDTPAVARNLRTHAETRGVDPARLVFATHASPAEHLARHELADLFLDTVPINAHTTASDALWMGLPVVTIVGGAFVGRVAASLVTAVGLPELATTSLADYESLALKLATDRVALGDMKARLAKGRASSPLFDPDRLRRHLERAYAVMHERSMHGEAPASFTVEPIDH
ncbi:MAG: tetratricopeptide repeat protein [Gemmatimonas sp.]